MTYKLNTYINQNILIDKVVNDDVYIKDKIVYITFNRNEFKYNKDNYHQKCGDKWINLQGGVPAYILEYDFNPDENIFYEFDQTINQTLG